MGLIELYRETGETRYLDLARFFIEERGKGVLNGSPYLQDHKPIREQITVTGHAVRQNYLAGGVVDLYAETGDQTFMSPVRQQWDDFINTKCYITGGAGARHEGEAYGDAYELPNDTAYAETCAAIAGFMWAWRMLQVDPQSRYADYMERALYNGILSGVSLDGKEYFYVNPLENDGKHRRTTKHFDGCACCPPNVARTLAALPGYIYGVHKGDNSVYLHHFIQSTATIPVGGKAVTIKQETDYPRDGKVTLTVTGVPAEFLLFTRIPGWVKRWNMAFQGQPQQMMGEKEAGQYVAIRLEKDTVVELNFEMPVEKCVADPRVKADKDKVAIQRGPMVYCFEQVDNPNVKLQKVSVGDSDFTPVYWADKLGGVMALEGTDKVSGDMVKLTAIPYFAWANREPGPMRVWMRE
jgi:DUF1680 family protein